MMNCFLILGILSANQLPGPPIKRDYVCECGGLQATAGPFFDGLPNGKLWLAYSLKWVPTTERHFWVLDNRMALSVTFTDVTGKELGRQAVLVAPSQSFLCSVGTVNPAPWKTVIFVDPPNTADFVSIGLGDSTLVVKQIPIVRGDRLANKKRSGESTIGWSAVLLKAQQIVSDMFPSQQQNLTLPRSSP